MSPPQKPWEGSGDRVRQLNSDQNNLGISSGRNALFSHGHNTATCIPSMRVPVSARASTLPPLPARPPQLTNSLYNRPTIGMCAPMYGGYSGFGSGYGSYGGYGASPYGGYGGTYGFGGHGFGSFPGGAFENRFLQVAEESSRDAFQSIESLVRTFTSISMMLESTYYAMYSSFRAVLGVVDNFSKLRQMFAQFLSAIAILRVIRHFYRRLLYWLGVLDQNPITDNVWDSVRATEHENAQVARHSKWPLITFIAFLFGGPYLMSKIFSTNTPDENHWDLKSGKYVRAAYSHRAGTQAELSFSANEVLNIAPMEKQSCEQSGWLLVCNQRGDVGYAPISRLVATVTASNQSTQPCSSESPAETGGTPVTS